MNKLIIVSCISMVLEKQIVRRASRLIRVRKVRCLRSIRWVLALPTVWTAVKVPGVSAPIIGAKLGDAK